ncbi:hypothetical protein BH11ACT8_BH11ACT8_03620 [soil metagenome]
MSTALPRVMLVESVSAPESPAPPTTRPVRTQAPAVELGDERVDLALHPPDELLTSRLGHRTCLRNGWLP